MNTTAAQDGFSDKLSSCAQPMRSRNIYALVSFFESGIKPEDSEGKLGIELEQIVVNEDGSPVSYSEEHGVAWLLDELSRTYPETTTDAEGDLLGVARENEAVTIEPAAQIELSAGPFSDLSIARGVFDEYVDRVTKILAPYGKKIIAVGYHPTTPARELELIPKQRYAFMNEYLSQADVYGPCMMRGSASAQISIDYTSTQDCLRKMRLAYALVPLISLMCDNAPMFEGKPRDKKLVRTDIWKHVDNDRCGLVPKALRSDFTLEDYAKFVLDTPAIVMPDGKGGWAYSTKTFGEIYADRPMEKADIEHAVSMQFPDVRLKTYLEIRPADSMPVPYTIAYAALIKGLFYSENSLRAMEDIFAQVDDASYEEAKNNLMENGYDAEVYGRPAAELCDAIIAIATSALSKEDAAAMRPLANLVAERVTLADLAERNLHI